MMSAENGSTPPVTPNVPSFMCRPARPADLGELGRRERAVQLAVELARAGERHVIDIEIEAHADGVGAPPGNRRRRIDRAPTWRIATCAG
jgi:hypothetical protein